MSDSNDSSNTNESSAQLSHALIREKILKNEYTTINKRGRSHVWNIFGKIIDDAGAELPNKVVCRKCCNVFNFNSTGTSNLVRHKCYINEKLGNESGVKIDVGPEPKQAVAKLCTQWVIESCRSFNIVNDSGFKKFAEYLLLIGVKYGAGVDVKKMLPNPTTTLHNIAKLYPIYKENIKKEITTAKKNGFGLTSDIWTDNYLSTSYMSLTMHYIKDGTLTNRLLGLELVEEDKCTGENVQDQICKLLQEFDCDISFKTTLVTGRNLNMIKPFQTNLNLACIKHLLHNTVTKSMEEVAEVAAIIHSCAKLVKYFEKSGLNARLTNSLKSSCTTRWNTTYYMLSSIEKNWMVIHEILHSNYELHRIDSININNLKAVTRILESFEEATKAFEDEHNATMHLVLIYLYKLKTLCTSNDSNTDLTQQLTEKLIFYLNSLVTPNIKIFHKIAVFLYPPFNKLVQFSEVERENVYDECLRLMQCFQKELPTIKKEILEDSQISERKELFSAFLPEEKNINSNENIKRELQLYKNTDVAYSDNFNVISWWEFNKNQFPFLFKLSCMVLSTPASCATSERIFSNARNVLNETWSPLYSNEVLINQIMFLHENLGKDEICDYDFLSADTKEEKVLH